MRQLKEMIPKAEFVKLRKYILDYLKRNGEANGHSSLPHEGLDRFMSYNKDLRPFAGMSPLEKSMATDNFWKCLETNKLVVRYVDQQGSVYYHLPTIPPFSAESMAILTVPIAALRRIAFDTMMGGDSPYPSFNSERDNP